MKYKDVKIEKNKLLISSPSLEDFFKRSVIYLTEHNDDGSIGFVLNKPTKFLISDIITDFPKFDAKVFLGGPVQTDLINFIHNCEALSEGSYKLSDYVYWGGNFEILKDLITDNLIDPNDILFFLGYSGWSPNQLLGEFMGNTWYITNPKKEFIYSQNIETLWNKVLKDMGGEYTFLATIPEDPQVN